MVPSAASTTLSNDNLNVRNIMASQVQQPPPGDYTGPDGKVYRINSLRVAPSAPPTPSSSDSPPAKPTSTVRINMMHVDVQPPDAPLDNPRAHPDFSQPDPHGQYPFEAPFTTAPAHDFSMLTPTPQSGCDCMCEWHEVSREGGPFPTPHNWAFYPQADEDSRFYTDFRNEFLTAACRIGGGHAKVSALLVYFCTRNHDSQQSTSVLSRKKGPQTRCDRFYLFYDFGSWKRIFLHRHPEEVWRHLSFPPRSVNTNKRCATYKSVLLIHVLQKLQIDNVKSSHLLQDVPEFIQSN